MASPEGLGRRDARPRVVLHRQGLDRRHAIGVALDAIEASWLDEVDRRTMRVAFEMRIGVLDPSSRAG